tara:strand:+ start:131 stop:937 length:807 start_codon:yes stop_codon:yes gene_type:complete
MSYTGLLRSARKQIRGFAEGGLTADEESTRRLSAKGLTGSSFQNTLGDEDQGKLLPAPGNSLVSRRSLGTQKESVAKKDMLTKYYEDLVIQNQKLKKESESVEGTISGSSEFLFDAKSTKFKSLQDDKEFMSELAVLKEKYPSVEDTEIFNVIFKESSFNPVAKSPAKAVGLFQFMPETLTELGRTSEQVLAMKPAGQLKVYGEYLKRWKYDGSFGLGILQAAPGKRNYKPDRVIYGKDSEQAKMNPGWQLPDGNVTRRSIENYYRGG